MHEPMPAGEPRPEDVAPRLTLWSHVWRMAVCLALSLIVWVPAAPTQASSHPELMLLDLGVGLGGYVLVFWRRRWPLPVAVLLVLAQAVSGTVNGPATLATVSLATRRRVLPVVGVAVLSFVTYQLWEIWQSPPAAPIWVSVLVNVLGVTVIALAGLLIGSRRYATWQLRHRAERAEAERDLRAEQARTAERARIAREMHDVLAHRISQISMHAGALSFRTDLEADALRQGAADIQHTANRALDDLRTVLGVLREDAEVARRPQPSLRDLGALVQEATAAGMQVRHVDHVVRGESVPEAVGRAAYRIVQEGLTNARKHAPGAVVEVSTTGGPEDGLTVSVRNPIGFGSSVPGAGVGLVGLRERAVLGGGRLEHRVERGHFVLQGWLPWAM